MFKFNFNKTENVSPPLYQVVEHHSSLQNTPNPQPALLHDYILEPPVLLIGEKITISPLLFLYKRHASDINFDIANDSTNPLSNTIINQTDLVAGEYEGGLKTWECSIDLTSFLNNMMEKGEIQLKGKSILEIGCGSGLPGILCLKQEALVDFQDYNPQVIHSVTIPNVLLNTSQSNYTPDETGTFESLIQSSTLLKNAGFYSGDWGLFETLLCGKQYDIIITSETLYNAESFPKLYKLIKNSLGKKGVVYMASKSNYFGCSGSMDGFRQLVDQDVGDDRLIYQTVYSVSETVRREIIKLHRFNE